MVQGKQKVISYKVHEKVSPPKEEWFVVENTHEPIIDRETFDKAQRVTGNGTHAPHRARNSSIFSPGCYVVRTVNAP